MSAFIWVVLGVVAFLLFLAVKPSDSKKRSDQRGVEGIVAPSREEPKQEQVGRENTSKRGASNNNREFKEVVTKIKIMVIPSYETMIEEFPKLKEVGSEKYDFFVTNAGVTCALLGNRKYSDTKSTMSLSGLTKQLRQEWGPDGPRAVEDCLEFTDDALSGPGEINDIEEGLKVALGMWIVWNVFGREPRDDESKLIGTLGSYAFEVGSSWWPERW